MPLMDPDVVVRQEHTEKSRPKLQFSLLVVYCFPVNFCANLLCCRHRALLPMPSPTQDVNSGASGRMHSIEQYASHIGEGLSQHLQIEPRCSWIYSLIL